ncbi:MAG: hypothetical protein GY869_00270, partial [Planctomycetes bacterium]|nr:hypothetical protein [Planctomycetota bacterium]
MNYSEVSDLCERINLGPESADGCSCSHQWQSMTLLLPNYSADSGGGIRDFDGTISKSYIYRNEAYNYGGGVYASDATITNTVIYDNTAYYGGGL